MNKRNKKRSIPIVVALLMIVLLIVGYTTKQEYVIQYLDGNQEMVTEVYTTIDSINSKITELDSLGIKYWVE